MLAEVVIVIVMLALFGLGFILGEVRGWRRCVEAALQENPDA